MTVVLYSELSEKVMSALIKLKKHLRAGQVYRRGDLEKWSNAVDRHIGVLVDEGRLVKVSGGMYMVPRKTRFGDVPADADKLAAGFLKDHRCLMVSPNAYNALGVGTTQLYNETVVYNHKRHARVTLGNRTFDFRKKPHFPRKLSKEFLLVDLIDNVDRLAEDRDEVLKRALAKAEDMDRDALEKAVRNFGGARARRLLAPLLDSEEKWVA